MIEKLIGPLIGVLADVIPGYKTAVVGFTAAGMAICEISNLLFTYGHAFDAVTWGAVSTGAGLTIAIRKYREMREDLINLKKRESRLL